jgi:hypothetical protein
LKSLTPLPKMPPWKSRLAKKSGTLYDVSFLRSIAVYPDFKSCTVYVVIFLSLLMFTGCPGRKPTTDSNADSSANPVAPAYGVKIKFAKGQKIELPDFTIECMGEQPPRSYEKYTRQEFRITWDNQEMEESWGKDEGDIGRVIFNVKHDKYMMEFIYSHKLGYLGPNVLVVWQAGF